MKNRLNLVLASLFITFLFSAGEAHRNPADDVGNNDKSLDELIPFVQSQTGAAVEGDVLIDSDISLTPNQFQSILEKDSKTFSGAGIKDEDRRWPKGIIPYVMEDNFEGLGNNVHSAIKEWMDNTCIVFTPRGSAKSKEAGHSHYITISGGGNKACQSGFGFTKSYHVCNLAVASGCAYHAMALHELGHSIGLAHEQQRPDRDSYLKVMKENIKVKMMPNFAVSNDVKDFGISYDYCSIMHYGPYSYAKSLAKMVYVTKDPDYALSIGGAKHLSFGDIKVVNLMYNCNAKCQTNRRCREPCYQDHKCQCRCPEERPCVKKPCRDYQSAEVCRRLKPKCNREKYANLWCAETCGVCAYVKAARGSDIIGGSGSGVGPVVPPTPKVKVVEGKPGPNCKDTQSGCSWFASRSNCRSNADIMRTCAKSCKLCLPCVDKHPYCEERAEQSHCVFNARFMLQDCKISCGLCV